MNGYPRWFTWRFVSGFVALSFLTGLFLTPSALDARFGVDVPWRLTADWRILMTAAHALMAFGIVWLIGAVWTIHMRVEWKKKRNRKSGAVLTSFWAVLVLSGIGIYYSGS